MLTRGGGFEILSRRRARWRLGQAREHRGFRERQFRRGLAEEAPRGGVDAISLIAEIDAV